MADPADLAALAAARAEARALEAEGRAASARLRAAEAQLARLIATGAPPARIEALLRRVEELADTRDESTRRLEEVRARIQELLDRIAAADGPEAAVAALDGGLPVALLPLRIETRFADAGTTLHIRVFPDQVHVDAHEPELTEDERAAGRAYWERRWPAPDDAEVAGGAWGTVAAGRRATRARWIVDVTTPANSLGAPPGPQHPDVALRAATWTRPARAVALPTRWVAIGRRGGRELFRAWSATVGDALDVAPSPEDDPARPLGTEGLRWLTEPQAARDAGMLLTVRDADLPGAGRLGDGIDELIVLGVDSTQPPDGAAGDLARLLAAHLYGDGLSFLAQGTPTNNTAETPSGHSTAPAALAGALDPAGAGPSGPGSGMEEPGDPAESAGARLAAALGIAPAALAGTPGAAASEHAVASALLDATWEATAGTYLGQLLRPVGRIRPMISDADIDQLRVWASAHLFASGPLPLVRIGRQPYGLLPVVDPARYRPPAGDRAAQMVAGTTAKLRRWWERGSRAVPRLDRATDLDAALVDLLQRAPVAATARFRRVLPRAAVANVVGLADLAQQQELHGWLVESMLDGRFSPRRLTIGTLTADARSHALRIPWARPAGLDPGATLPYVRELRDLLTAPGGRDTLATRGRATALAEALLALSAALELDAAHGRVVKDFADIVATPSPLVEAVRVRHPETIGTGLEEVDGGPLSFATPKVLADARIPDLTGAGTVADLVRGHLAGAGGGRALDGLRRLRSALDRLGDEPGEGVEWALRGLLDLYSYRFDAWCTALATQRLTDLRAARPAGVHLGAYGWVEDVRPDPAGRDNLGYVHTPSLNHAVAAAVLRSAHVARASSAPGAFAVDLSARRVRDAMTLLDGVENGQPLGALLGYRIERLLRERDAILARYILPLRRLAPLRHTDADLSEPVESIAARDVVDGVALLEKWRAPGGRDAVLSGIGILGQHGTPVSAVIDAADDLLDAVGDVLLSEAVYQTVAGNQDRAGAALAALDRQQRPVAPEVVQSPRSGTTVAHRVLVLLRNGAAPGWPVDPRAGAEPRLNAWVARLLGPPAAVVFAGEVRRGGAVRATVTATAAELGLSPLSVVLAVRRPAGDRPSELESRLAAVLAAKVPDGTEDDSLVLLPDGPGGAWGLAAIATVATWVERIAGRPAASAHDLQPLLHDQPPGWDVAELAGRAGRAVAALTAALAAVGPAVLAQAAELGVADSLPGTTGETVEEQAARVRVALHGATERVVAEAAAFAEREGPSGPGSGMDEPTPDQAVAHHLRRLRIVLGEGFPALPLFQPAGAGGMAPSLADRPALLGGDDLAPLPWLHRVALVRPALDPLSALLSAAEANGRDLGLPHLDVAQLPHEPGRRWVALPPPAEEEVPGGTVGIVIHAPDGIDPAGPAAGVVVDEWTEVVPATAEMTALSFHYDAPAAHPPHAILLAVPGVAGTARWSFDELLGAVREAVALTHLRAVGPRDLPDLGGLLPALYVPQDVTGDVPTIDLFDLVERVVLDGVQPSVLGKG